MSQIKRILIANHTHHDIGFNDYQGVAARQHGEFVRDALDLIESTADRAPADQYRWVCEVTAPVVRYLREAGASEQERFRYWQSRGAIDVAAMQYNLTPLLTPEQMRRSLYPVRVLREEMGISVETAMQDDVNGISWMFADLLPSIGVDFLTLAINQSRGRAPRPFPGGFWWEGPAGGRLLTWNGFHYLFGRSQAKLGDWRFVDESLPYYLDTLEADESFPYDTLYVESTHPMRVDNGPPDARMAQFVQEWNAQGRTPVLEFATPRIFRDYLREGWADALPTWRGDWTDWWADGAASSAYETALNRSTHEVLAAAETLGAWLIAGGRSPDLAGEFVESVYESMTLYDEHTWGGFSSIDAPESLFSRAQWNKKANFAYDAAMHSHDMLTRNARAVAGTLADRIPEGRFNLGDLDTEAAYPSDERAELLVFNTLPRERTVIVEVPEFRSGGAPAGMLESFFPRDVPWGGPPHTEPARVRVTVPAWGYAFVPDDAGVADADLHGSAEADVSTIENAAYRVVVSHADGRVLSWYDKAAEREYADAMPEGSFADAVHEIVDSPAGRDALYLQDFGSWDFGYWQTDPPFERRRAETVQGVEIVREPGLIAIDVTVTLRGTRSARLRLALPAGERVLHVDWHIDKSPLVAPESLYVLFPLRMSAESDYLADVNGVAIRPDVDQLPGSVRDFFPLRRWVDAADEEGGVTLVALDAPLVQLGGITTNRIADEFVPERAAIVSWAMNNDWMVNFKASQEGPVKLRYRLTTHAGACDPVAAEQFAQDQSVPLIVLRDYIPGAGRQGREGHLLPVVEAPQAEVTVKPASDGAALLLRVRNLTGHEVAMDLSPWRRWGTVTAVTVLEGRPVSDVDDVEDIGEIVEVPPHAERSWRIAP